MVLVLMIKIQFHLYYKKKINLKPNQKIEVINAGISGATSLSEIKLIKERLIKFSPDLIIAYDGFNDIKRYFGENVSLENSDLSMGKVASKCGFKSPSRFSDAFRRVEKISPKDYRRVHTYVGL